MSRNKCSHVWVTSKPVGERDGVWVDISCTKCKAWRTRRAEPADYPDESEVKEAYERERTMSGEHEFSRGLLTVSPAPVSVAQPYRAPEPRDPSDAHFRISMFKSALRLVACVCLPFSIVGGAVMLGVAELLGIVEEL